tara:strand:- start:419 stop:901 length:483 start_codon:yes stop_codon:yes gene_type:complete
LESKNQILIIVFLSVLASFTFNHFRSEGSINLRSVPLSKVGNISDTDVDINQPVREIKLELAKKLHSEGVLFVDARAKEYIKDGLIPDAIFNDDLDSLAEKINDLINLNTAFVVYCSDDDCGSSEELAYQLEGWGFTNILVFKGGWKSWIEAGMEIGNYE